MNLSFNFSAVSAGAISAAQQLPALAVQSGMYGLLWASAHPLVAAALITIPAVNAGLYYATHSVKQYSIDVKLSDGDHNFKGTRSEVTKKVKAKLAEITTAIKAQEESKETDTLGNLTADQRTLNRLLSHLNNRLNTFNRYRNNDAVPKADLTGTAYAFLHTAVLTASVAALASAGGAWMLAACVLGAVALPEAAKLPQVQELVNMVTEDEEEQKIAANAISTILLAGMVGGLPAAGIAVGIEALAVASFFVTALADFDDKLIRPFVLFVNDANKFIVPQTSFVEACKKQVVAIER